MLTRRGHALQCFLSVLRGDVGNTRYVFGKTKGASVLWVLGLISIDVAAMLREIIVAIISPDIPVGVGRYT